MNESPSLDDTILLEAYREEAERYGRALALAADLPAALQRDAGGNEILRQLLAVLDEVAAIEARIAQTKHHWHRNGRKPGVQFQSALDEVAKRIQLLAAQIQRAEQQAVAQQNTLAPELEALARSQQMQRAYAEWR